MARHVVRERSLVMLLRDIDQSVEFLSIDAARAGFDQHYAILQPKRRSRERWRTKGEQCKEGQQNSGAQVILPAAVLATTLKRLPGCMSCALLRRRSILSRATFIGSASARRRLGGNLD